MTNEPESTRPTEARPAPTEPALATEPAPTEPAPAAGPSPAEPTPATEPVPVGGRRRARLVPLVSGALALLLVGGGAVAALHVLDGADRDSPTVVMPDSAAGAQATPEATAPATRAGLGGRLLPVPTGYELGPDIGEFGNDETLGAQQAGALLKQGDRGLPADQREKWDHAVDGLKVKGVALRSYSDGTFVTEMRLSQMGNAEAIKNLNDFQRKFMSSLKALRAGPKIGGHANAVCFLLPKDDELKLDAMFCNAYEGDVMVTTYTYAPAPLDTDAAAVLLRKQLDLIKSPGESV
ncbi:hypothetical protein [Streptomyces sp. NPDC048111]|uniref:hypothetical protein n=1 Tax=Streptomyces sp. NPDC048111 TaxID=3365500 RepID=UPI0037217CB6